MLKGYFSRQRLWIVRWGMIIQYTTTLPLSFHTKKLYSGLYSMEIELYFFKQKSLFEPSFGGLRGNVRTPSIARDLV